MQDSVHCMTLKSHCNDNFALKCDVAKNVSA